MTLHKLSAGGGYSYLTRQVARLDAQGVRGGDLGSYYAEKGETPGRWLGSGLPGLGTITAGDPVTEEQMRALFGEGRHPDDDAIRRRLLAEGATPDAAERAGRLGRAFPTLQQLSDFRTRCAQAYQAAGCTGETAGAEQQRAAIRTQVATQMFTDTLARAPLDARELNGFIIRSTRRPAPVAGYDLTFSPVKSVSTLWALAPVQTARVIEDAHQAAVEDAIGWLESEAVFTRKGRGGVRQVEVTGVLATAFTHRDTRSGDPDLHTHVAVANKVQTRDGQWLAVDGRVLHKAAVAASERYNTRLESELRARLGVHFTDRPNPDPRKRPVREITGVDTSLMQFWSTRRAAIDAARADLERAFQIRHGRPPTPAESLKLAQEANLSTRAAKHEPRSEAEQRAQWRAEAIACLSHDDPTTHAQTRAARTVDRMLQTAQAAPPPPSTRLTPQWVADTARAVVATTESARATWQQWHLIAEIHRAIRAANIAPDERDAAYSQVLAAALSGDHSVPVTPDGDADPLSEPVVLRRSTGHSQYQVAGMDFYTSAAVLAAEQRIVALASTGGGARIDDTYVDLALLEATANGRPLNPGQEHLVREFATSGARLQLAIAPAGSGKTTATSVLSRAWQDAGGTVIGLSPTAAGASVLAEELATTSCDTLAKLVWHANHGGLPDWATGVDDHTLVVIDEAGMASTADLDVALTFLAGRGATIRMVGDDQQLASVSCGGVLRDIATTTGALTLSELVRFHDAAEGSATLALRAGDRTGIGFYLDNDRVTVGGAQTMLDATYARWRDDVTAGVDSVMLAPRRDIVAAVNARARTDRLTTQVGDPGRQVRLPDGNQASAGDIVLTRSNNRRLGLSGTDYVRNGHRWRILAVEADGSLRVANQRTGARTRLPADYVSAHVELGYATTIHTAQGVTADRCRLLADDTLDRQLLYVGLTRGRQTNSIALVVVGDGDPHDQTTPAAVHPDTATEILEKIVARDASQVSATTRRREAARPQARLGPAAARYHDALGVAAQTVAGPDVMSRIDQTAERVLPGLADDPTYDVLRQRLALIHLRGGDPADALTQAVRSRELGTARDVAAVLDWRLHTPDDARPGPLPWLPAVPPALAQHPDWGPYLTARSERVIQLTDRVRADAVVYTPDSCPAWVGALGLAHDDPLVAALAVWRYANVVDDTDVRPTGEPRFDFASARHQHRLEHAIVDRGGGTGRSALAQAADRIDPRITADPTWAAVEVRLDALARAGVNIAAALTTAAATGPLPDDMPAAGLWWRISRTTDPAALTGAAPAYRPPWFALLVEELGPHRAHRVVTDPAWTGLLAAVNQAQRSGLDPDHVVTVAVQMTDPGRRPADGGIPDPDLARALTVRVTALTHHTQVTFAHPADVTDEAIPTPEEQLAWLDEIPEHADRVWDANDEQPPAAGPDEPVPWPDLPPPTDANDAWPDLPQLRVQLQAAMLERQIIDTLRQQHPGGLDPCPAHLDEPVQGSPAERDRIYELNAAAFRFYADQMPGSCAPGYLQHRLGNAAGRVDAGYAPAGWTALTDHLRALGATGDELLAAGLAITSSRGTLIDAFRDRIVLPLRDGDRIVGFVGRRNPGREVDDQAGPKYLNTRNTAAYHKSSHLYGLSEGTAANPDAVPVLVEGLFDAHAVTGAGDGRYIGVAPLGTALTPEHVHRLLARAPAGRVLVATDPDAAGRKAAKQAYWLLVDHGLDPRHVHLPDCIDPADLLQRRGRGALREALDQHQPLVHSLIDTLACRPDDFVERRVAAMRQAAALIAPLPAEQWPGLVERARAKCDDVEETALIAMIDAAGDRTERLRRPLDNPASTNSAAFTHRNPGRRRPVQVLAMRPPSSTPPRHPKAADHTPGR